MGKHDNKLVFRSYSREDHTTKRVYKRKIPFAPNFKLHRDIRPFNKRNYKFKKRKFSNRYYRMLRDKMIWRWRTCFYKVKNKLLRLFRDGRKRRLIRLLALKKRLSLKNRFLLNWFLRSHFFKSEIIGILMSDSLTFFNEVQHYYRSVGFSKFIRIRYRYFNNGNFRKLFFDRFSYRSRRFFSFYIDTTRFIVRYSPFFRKAFFFIFISPKINNFFVYATDSKGNILVQKTAGSVGFLGPKRCTIDAAVKTTQAVVFGLYKHTEINKLAIVVKGPLDNRVKPSIAKIKHKFDRKRLFSDVFFVVSKSHNGLRPKKIRRI